MRYPIVTFTILEVTPSQSSREKKDSNKISFVTVCKKTLQWTDASFVLTMQTAVGFVRSLYDNENHYRITWGFRTWEQQGGERRATLGLINGLWRCPSGHLYGFFFLLFYPFLSFTTPLSFASSVLRCKSERACSERLTECKPNSPLRRRKEEGWQAEVFMT